VEYKGGVEWVRVGGWGGGVVGMEGKNGGMSYVVNECGRRRACVYRGRVGGGGG
jgi:hypothetical protein